MPAGGDRPPVRPERMDLGFRCGGGPGSEASTTQGAVEGERHEGEAVRAGGRSFGRGPRPGQDLAGGSRARVAGGFSQDAAYVALPSIPGRAAARLASPAGHLRGGRDHRTLLRRRVRASGVRPAGARKRVGGRRRRAALLYVPRTLGRTSDGWVVEAFDAGAGVVVGTLPGARAGLAVVETDDGSSK